MRHEGGKERVQRSGQPRYRAQLHGQRRKKSYSSPQAGASNLQMPMGEGRVGTIDGLERSTWGRG